MTPIDLPGLADELASDIIAGGLSGTNRPMRLVLGDGSGNPLHNELLVQAIDIREQLNHGVEGFVTCVATRTDLPLQAFEGVQIEVQVVTARGTLRRIRGVVRKVRRGQSDGGLCIYQLAIVDPLQLLHLRTGRRVFRSQSAVEITRTVLDEVRRGSPRFGRAFDYVMQLDSSRYPQREFTLQADESMAQFLIRVWKRAGISFFFRPTSGVARKGAADFLELVLFDDAMRLEANVGGELRYHRQAATEAADAIVLWAESRQLVSGSVMRQSWDYKARRMAESSLHTIADQGSAGDEIASFLRDMQIARPHDGDDLADFERATRLRMTRLEFEAACVHGMSGSRDIQVGEWNPVTGHALIDRFASPLRAYVFTEIHHRGDNNLKQIAGRAQKLLERSVQLPGWERMPSFGDERADLDAGHRYLNRFTAVQRGTPLVPSWRPREDLPPMRPITAIVSGPEGHEVYTDALGRYKVSLQGLDPEEHASGAGTSNTDRDSAWVRMSSIYAGQGVGLLLPLRAGMECELEFSEGDPDRPFIARVYWGAGNRPAQFDHLGALPENRAQSGLITREFDGTRQNQLRFVDTPRNISVQLASDHGTTQFNAGSLATPMNQGSTQPRGEGFEIRTDESGVLRSAKSMLITAWARLLGAGRQLDAQEPIALMQEGVDLAKSLGQYGVQHGGLPLDVAPVAELHADVAGAAAGSNTEPKGVGGKPTLSFSAPAGIATTTPKTILGVAGVNIDSVAQQHVQVTAGQHVNVNAGQGIGLFAHHGGLQAIAHHDRLLLQAQHGNVEANAAHDVRWTATNGNLIGMAKEIHLIADDGSFIRIGAGGITLGTNGVIAMKASSFSNDPPATMSAEFPTFSDGPPDQRFELRFGDASGPLAPLTRYEIEMSDGSKLTGVSDAQGLTELLQRDAMHVARIRMLSEKS